MPCFPEVGSYPLFPRLHYKKILLFDIMCCSASAQKQLLHWWAQWAFGEPGYHLECVWVSGFGGLENTEGGLWHYTVIIPEHTFSSPSLWEKGLWEAVPFPRQCHGTDVDVSHTEQRLGHPSLSQSVPLAQLWHQLFRGNECGREHRRRAERGVCLLSKGCVGHSRKVCISSTPSCCGRVWPTLILSSSFKSVAGQVQELITT